MPPQPSTRYATLTQQQPFTLAFEHQAWHVTFPGYGVELDVHGSRIEAQAIARCYHSLFLMPGAPLGCADLDECARLDLAEQEAAIEIEVQQRRMNALLYGASGDGAFFPHVQEPPVRYRAGGLSPSALVVACLMSAATGSVAVTSDGGRDADGFQRDVLGLLAWALRKTNGQPDMPWGDPHRLRRQVGTSRVHEASARYGHGADRGDGRDARGRFIAGSQTASRCSQAGFWAAIESIQARYPDATYTRAAGDEVHISRSFFSWLQSQGRA